MISFKIIYIYIYKKKKKICWMGLAQFNVNWLLILGLRVVSQPQKLTDWAIFPQGELQIIRGERS